MGLVLAYHQVPPAKEESQENIGAQNATLQVTHHMLALLEPKLRRGDPKRLDATSQRELPEEYRQRLLDMVSSGVQFQQEAIRG